MNAGTKLAAYGLVLATMLGLGAAVGAAVGPIDVGGNQDRPHSDVPTTRHTHEHHGNRPEQP